MKLTVQLLTYNSRPFVGALFDSLRKQTFKDWELLILDNASTDSTVEGLKKALINFPIQNKFLENKENNGFAGGHNQLFKLSDSEYFLLLNHDIVLLPDTFENLVNFLDSHAEITAASPRLMHCFRCSKNGDIPSFSNEIDSLGLKVYKNRRVTDYLSGQDYFECQNNFRDKEFLEMFGVSGAMPIFRRENIKQILDVNGSFLDEDLKMYKEDVDLAYRLSAAGMKSAVVLDSVAYHYRTGNGADHSNDAASAKNKKQQPLHVRQNSYRNHLIVLYKNEYWQNFVLDFFPILWYELKKFLWFLLFDREVLGGLKDVWNMRQELKNKRKEIISKRKLDWKQMRKRIYQ